MNIDKELMQFNKKLYNKLFNLCNFENVKFEAFNGIIFKIKHTNINFIEPHRFIITVGNIKIILLCYDNLHLYLYDKHCSITMASINKLINKIKEMEE